MSLRRKIWMKNCPPTRGRFVPSRNDRCRRKIQASDTQGLLRLIHSIPPIRLNIYYNLQRRCPIINNMEIAQQLCEEMGISWNPTQEYATLMGKKLEALNFKKNFSSIDSSVKSPFFNMDKMDASRNIYPMSQSTALAG